ncbi:MAG: polyprenyl synthetase family protein [Patescibacteria group bacterium]
MKKYFQQKLPLIEKTVGQILPPKVTQSWLKKHIGEVDYQFNPDIWLQTISRPFYHMFASGGKRFRPVLTYLLHDIFTGRNEDIDELAVIPELIHSGTLIIDDIEDKSLTRRGKKCVYQQFGTAISVNNGNFLYYFAQKIIHDSHLSDQKKILAYQIITDKLTSLHLGQAMDIEWSQQHDFSIDEADYLQMTAYKTSALLSVAMQLGAIAADHLSNLRAINDIAKNMGMAFQIRDDILNLKPTGAWGKATGEDISEGKISLLVIHTIKKAQPTDKKKLIHILSQSTTDKKLISQAIDIIDHYQAFNYAQELANKLISQAKTTTVKNLPANQYRKILLQILDYCIQREK